MDSEIVVAVAAFVLASIGALAAMFGTDSRDQVDDDWRHNTHTRAQI